MEDHRAGAAGAVRPSDADREVVEARLKTAVADGRLTLEEFADRMGFALSAESSDELSQVTSDLPAVRAPAAPVRAASGARAGGKERRWLVAVLGAFSTSRRWRPARSTNAVAVMGAGEVDLRSAEIEGDEVTINAVAVMGSIEVIVPRGVDVDVTGFDVMGAREIAVDESSLVEGAPLVRVNGYTLMGSLEIRNETEKEARKRAKAEGREPSSGATAAGATFPATAPHGMHRTPSGPNEQKSWWGKLALGAAGIWLVFGGGFGVVSDALPGDAFAIMGGRVVTVSPQQLAAAGPQGVQLDVGAVMGGIEVVVPPGTQVDNGVIGIMGGSNVEVGAATGAAQPGLVEVDGFALMGGVNITDDQDGGGGDDDQVEELEEQIEDLTEARDAAADAGGPTAEIDDEIDDLRRELLDREG